MDSRNVRREASAALRQGTESMPRVVYSFPHRIGAGRICNTAWHQAAGVAAAGADTIVWPGVVSRPFPPNVAVRQTLAWGPARISYKAVGGFRAARWHDRIVAGRLAKLAPGADVVHVWPTAALDTLRAAGRLGIPSLLERPNAHTRFAYEAVRRECRRLKVELPWGDDHAFNDRVLRIEEEEYSLASRLLCPSDFVRNTFLRMGFPPERLVRHQYGYDPAVFYPAPSPAKHGGGLRMLFAGQCTPRKGLHYALEAWLRSPAHRDGIFEIAGGFVPGYAEALGSMLDHPSVRVLGHRTDVAGLMRRSDVFILPSIEEGSALVTYEARACGCVLVVSEASGADCRHAVDGLVHAVGDVAAIADHITMLREDAATLRRLREASLASARELTWEAAGARLLAVYRGIIEDGSRSTTPEPAGARVTC